MFRNIRKITPVLKSIFNKVIKQAFIRNAYFEEHLWTTTASESFLLNPVGIVHKWNSRTEVFC